MAADFKVAVLIAILSSLLIASSSSAEEDKKPEEVYKVDLVKVCQSIRNKARTGIAIDFANKQAYRSLILEVHFQELKV